MDLTSLGLNTSLLFRENSGVQLCINCGCVDPHEPLRHAGGCPVGFILGMTYRVVVWAQDREGLAPVVNECIAEAATIETAADKVLHVYSSRRWENCPIDTVEVILGTPIDSRGAERHITRGFNARIEARRQADLAKRLGEASERRERKVQELRAEFRRGEVTRAIYRMRLELLNLGLDARELPPLALPSLTPSIADLIDERDARLDGLVSFYENRPELRATLRTAILTDPAYRTLPAIPETSEP